MSTTEIPQGFTPFKQIPTWDDNETFTLTGKELKAVQSMVESYSKFITTMDAFFVKNLDNGKIKVLYEDMEGNPMNKEQIDEMYQEYSRILAESLNGQVQ